MIQDTAWSPRFVPSTTATAATSGEAIAGTDTTKFITPSLLPAATSYHAGPVVNGRAPRQGLVFDGTAGATHSNITLGSGDFTVAIWARVPTTSAANRQLLGSSGGDTALFLDTTGLAKIYISGQTTHTASSVVPDQKSVLIVYTRSGTSGTFYQNAVSNGAVTDSNNYSTAWSYFGARSGGGYTTGFLSPLIYNRALSASEVVALYEAGAPAGADYNSASNTAINTSNWNNSNWPYTSYTGVSSTGFTAVMSTANIGIAEIVPTPVNGTTGQRIRVTFSATLTSGVTPTLRLFNAAYTTVSNAVALTAGSNTVELVATAPFTKIGFYTSGVTSYAVSGISVVRAGLLLAPDAAQAGGGLAWYDTSGNAANITLPASGVSWNVPSSRVLGGDWTNTGNLTVSGTASVSGQINGSAGYQFRGASGTTYELLRYVGGANNPGIFTTVNESTKKVTIFASGSLVSGQTLGLGAEGSEALTLGAANATLAGNLTVSGGTISSGTASLTLKSTSNTVVLQSAGTTALTLDSSQNATFAGTVKIANTAAINGVYTTTTTFDFGTIANNDASSVCTLTMTGVSSSDSIIVSPTDGDNFPQFCTVSAVPSGNSVSVRLYNGSGSSRTVGSRTIRVTAIKF